MVAGSSGARLIGKDGNTHQISLKAEPQRARPLPKPRSPPQRPRKADNQPVAGGVSGANVQHPTYKALAELGKAVKTVFLCRYLNGLPLRHEIHEGLNVIEQWNSANDFVFFARKGELASNRREDHEISMLALHLLQNAMVYINTLMIQHTLDLPAWANRLTRTDRRALTPLIWEHINPYGRFDLDMTARLPLA